MSLFPTIRGPNYHSFDVFINSFITKHYGQIIGSGSCCQSLIIFCFIIIIFIVVNFTHRLIIIVITRLQKVYHNKITTK